MEATAPAPWPLLLAGLVLLGAGLGLGRRPDWLRALLGSVPARPLAGPARRLPLVIGGLGAGWVATYALMAFPYPNAVKPYWAVCAIVILLPAVPLAFIATGAWVLLLRARPKTPA